MTTQDNESKIVVGVRLDDKKVPTQIRWTASDSTADEMQKAKAMLLSLWDGEDKAALRIDLWTKEMMVDEMVDFYYQCFMGMADSLQRATGQQKLADDLKEFAKSFFQQFQESQRKGG